MFVYIINPPHSRPKFPKARVLLIIIWIRDALSTPGGNCVNVKLADVFRIVTSKTAVHGWSFLQLLFLGHICNLTRRSFLIYSLWEFPTLEWLLTSNWILTGYCYTHTLLTALAAVPSLDKYLMMQILMCMLWYQTLSAGRAKFYLQRRNGISLRINASSTKRAREKHWWYSILYRNCIIPIGLSCLTFDWLCPGQICYMWQGLRAGMARYNSHVWYL